ncbi:MAG: tetratricopeptide repeat protein [bacterium]|nr:tetratricopeptide repeat protein [candidate division KSB1 bacterium]MDH7561545.1 tetratricopeptide repeat protein [bacterium]
MATRNSGAETPPTTAQPQVDPLVSRLVIRGATAEALGDLTNALSAYQEAALHAPQSFGIQMAMGEVYLRLGKTESALLCLRKAAELNPRSAEAHGLLGNIYAEQRKLDLAEAEFRALLEVDPRDADALGRLISLMVAQGKTKAALQQVKQFAKHLPQDVDYLVQVGNLFYQARAYTEARELYRMAMAVDRQAETPYLAVAAACKAEGDTTQAIAWYRRALQVDPTFDEVQSELRALYAATKRWDEALAVFAELAKTDSANVEHWLDMGRVHLMKGDTLAAAKAFAQAHDRFPDDERTAISLGLLQESLRDTAAALATYRRALTANPNFARVRKLCRNLLVARKQWEEAIQLYEQAGARDSSDVVNGLEIAELYFQKGDTATALAHLEALASRFPNDWRVPFAAGRMEFMRRNWSQAGAYFEKVIALNDRVPPAWSLLGRCHLLRNELQQAEAVFRRAAGLFPDDGELNFFLGSVLSQMRKPAEALPFITKALEDNEDNVPVLLVLAACYSELRRDEEADSVYTKILALDPENPTALNNYSYSLAERGIRLDEALLMVEKALQAEPENGAFLDTIGWVYFKLGDYQRALEKILKSVEVRPGSAEVIEHLGDVYEKLGELSKAQEYWQKALELDPSRTHLEQKLKGTSHTRP